MGGSQFEVSPGWLKKKIRETLSQNKSGMVVKPVILAMKEVEIEELQSKVGPKGKTQEPT
jgi:hypothetical protein